MHVVRGKQTDPVSGRSVPSASLTTVMHNQSENASHRFQIKHSISQYRVMSGGIL